MIRKLYNACHFGDADLAIDPLCNGVNVVNPLSRVLLSYFASVYVHYWYENS
jgi:dolichol-phosphate mannosyltransferase